MKLGLSDGSGDQHLSISDLHSESQESGIGGRSVLLTIPPELQLKYQLAAAQHLSQPKGKNIREVMLQINDY